MCDAFNIPSHAPTICYRLLSLLNDFLFQCYEACASNRAENNNLPCSLASESSYIMYVLAEAECFKFLCLLIARILSI